MCWRKSLRSRSGLHFSVDWDVSEWVQVLPFVWLILGTVLYLRDRTQGSSLSDDVIAGLLIVGVWAVGLMLFN